MLLLYSVKHKTRSIPFNDLGQAASQIRLNNSFFKH